MEEPRVMPSTIDYSRMLPLSIPAMSRRQKFFPTNGSTFTRQGNRQIRIEIGSTSSLLDCTHSYIELHLLNQSGVNVGLDIGGATTLFENIRVEQGGKLLSYTQNVNRLHSAILAPAQDSTQGVASGGCTGLQRGYNTAGAASVVPAAAGDNGDVYSVSRHNAAASLGNGQLIRLSMPITSGLFSQDKLIPLPLVDPKAPITLVLDLANPQDVGVWTGGAAPPAAGLLVQECSYIAHLIDVGPDVIQQFKGVQAGMGGQLAISGQDYEYFSGAVPNGQQGQFVVACPARKRSIKSMFWCSQSNDMGNTAGPIGQEAVFNLSFAGSNNIDNFQFRVGPLLYPPTAVNCWGVCNGAASVGNEFLRSEPLMELAKAVGTMSKQNPTGNLNTITYGCDDIGLASGENGVAGATHAPISASKYGVTPFGISTDSFMRDVIESGVDSETLAQDTFLQLTWNGGNAAGAEDQIVHIWCLFDQHYYFNADGSVSYSN